MTETKSAVAIRITLVVCLLVLSFGSGAVALTSIANAEDATTDHTVESDSMSTLDIGHLNPVDPCTVQSQFESVIQRSSTPLIKQLPDRGNGVVPPLWAVLFGYSRYDDSDPLENDIRRQVYDAIEQSPGTYISEVSERTDASRSTVRYHVRILEEEGLIDGEAVRGKHRFYPANSEDPALAAAMNDESTARVLDSIARLEPAAVSTLAEDLDRAPGTVSYHLDRLADDGLVERERVGHSVVTQLAEGISIETGEEPIPANAD